MNQRRRFSQRLPIAALAFIAFGGSTQSMADAASERTELVRLLHELENLELVVANAETAAVSTQRIRFQYTWLRGDIEKVKAGILEYLDTAPVTPRVPPPLAGDYIR